MTALGYSSFQDARLQPPDPEPSIYEDYNRVAEILADAKVGQDWLTDAIAYAMCNDDWGYLQSQVEKHAMPIVERAEFLERAA